ncbi:MULTISPECIES: RNA polymerase sigma factor [Sphingomonas]|uniref:RNA polymerase sigma factor n=1 Tax=Sphingomonas TaxID=13687 RepID=UPI0010468973|nr:MULTISPECIES: RNA polymerase sigma factor [Sphingomonas]TCQ08442.1 RNA polymerase sigma-70 factor (ECF subfamily) [Sphingomonas sp. PP-CC-3A-396]
MTAANLTATDPAPRGLWQGWSRLRAQVERMTRRTDGEDLLHDAYVSMAGLATAPRNDEAFLVHAAVNRGRDAFRREAVRGACEPAEAIDWLRDPAPIQDEVMIAKARLARVREGIDRLTPRTREIFLMQRLDGYKYREIAERLDISQGAVEKHMAKAMTFLADWTEGW